MYTGFNPAVTPFFGVSLEADFIAGLSGVGKDATQEPVTFDGRQGFGGGAHPVLCWQCPIQNSTCQFLKGLSQLVEEED